MFDVNFLDLNHDFFNAMLAQVAGAELSLVGMYVYCAAPV